MSAKMFWLDDLKGRAHLAELIVFARIILKLIMKKTTR
jgi:hypothetical protein